MQPPTLPTDPSTPARAGRREWIGLAVLALPCLLYSMDLTVLNLAVPHLTADLHPTSTELLWISDIYGFLVAGSLITMGTLGDRIGRRKLLLIGAVAFGGASIFAAFAQTAAMLIAARAILGVAAATIAPSTLSLISNMFHDDRQRTVAVGIWIGCFSAGGALGPMLGGLLLEHFWWGSVFLLAVPVMVLLLVLGPRLLPEFRDPAPGRIDLRSAGLSIAAVLAVIYGVKRIAVHGPGAAALAIIAAGVALGAIFVRRQHRLAHPLLDLSLFRHRAFTVCLAIYVLGAFAAFGSFLTIAQYLQTVLALRPFEAGLWTATSGAAFILGSLVAPALSRRHGKVAVMTAGLAVAALGAFLFARLGDAHRLDLVVAGLVVFSLGMSLTFTLAVDLVVASAPPARAGSASALAETGAELGGATGMAILGTVTTAIYRAGVADRAPDGVPADALQTVGASLQAADALPAPAAAALLSAVRTAYADSIGVTSTICALALVAAAITAALLLRPSPRRSACPDVVPS